MGDRIVIACDNVCLGVMLTSFPERRLELLLTRGFMTIEFFWETLLSGR